VKTLLFGPRGFLGEHFLKGMPGCIPDNADIADPVAVRAALDAHKPDFVINAAGKTGRPNVDWCEEHKEETIRANVTGPLVLLDECRKRGIMLVHLSSGCIYAGDNGGKGFTEEDEPNFHGSFYARSKIWAEQVLKEFPAEGPERSRGVLILRLRMPFDDSRHPRSLITKVSKYARVLDEENSLTYLPEFVQAAKILMEKGKTGIYNVVNPGQISPFGIMSLYKEIVDPSHAFERLSVEKLGEVVKAGRSNCILSGEKLQKEGVILTPVEKAVESALRAIKMAS
jgi:3,5-epimerase/4-reductase